MARERVYSVSFEEISISAVQDLFQVIAAAGKPIRIIGFVLGQRTLTTTENLGILIHRGTTNGSGGGSPTPAPLNPSDSAAAFTAETNNTTQATEGTILHGATWNVVGPFIWLPPPEMWIDATGGGEIVVELQTAPSGAMTAYGTLYVMEAG